MKNDFALGQLRHLYSLMMKGHVKDPAEAARGLLGPSIERLESAARASEGEVEATWNLAIEAAADIANRAKRDAYVLRGVSAGGAYHRADEALRIAGNIAEEIRALKREAK